MVKVLSKDRFYDLGARGRFGSFGEPDPLGKKGIYQRRTRYNKKSWCKMVFYEPANPQTVPQQAWRTTFANGMASWAGLTQEQKDVYNNKAKGKPLHGVNIYMREWLNSH